MEVLKWLKAVRWSAASTVAAKAKSRTGPLSRSTRVALHANVLLYLAEELEQRLVLSAPPFVSSITRSSPTSPITNQSSVTYSVVFTESVTGVSASDFQVVTSGSVQASTTVALAGSGSAYTATVSGIRGNGNLQLELVDNDTILDSTSQALGGTGLGNGSFVAPAYTIIQTGPQVLSIARGTPSSSLVPIGTTSVSYNVTFSEAVTGVDFSDFALLAGGSVTYTGGTVTPINGSSYTLTVNGITGSGTLGVNLIDNGTITDVAGNPLQENAATAGSFQAIQSFTAGTISDAVAVGDLNGDGIPDLVVANSSSSYAGVLLGNGNGTFQTPKTFSTATAPNSVAIADMNGDGIPDLVVISTGIAGILLGNGDGTFQTERTISAGPYSQGVAVADLNGDGKPDVAVADYSTGVVGVLLGNGDGTLQTLQTFAAGTGAYAVSAADLNSDGKLDLVVPDSSANGVSVLMGNGNGTFAAAQSYATASRPTSISIADLNGDGLPDVITTNATANNVGVFLDSANGTLQPPHTFAVGTDPLAAAAVDLNGDGKIDLAVVNGTGQSISTLLGNGDGSFQSQKTIAIGSPPLAIAAADLNSDGRPDWVFTGSGTMPGELSLSNGNGNFTGQSYTILGPAAQLAIAQPPTGGPAGGGIGTVTVNVEDAFGTTVNTDTSAVTLTLSSGVFVGTNLNTATVNAVAGVATFSGLVMNTTGTYTLTASDGTNAPAVATFAVSSGPVALQTVTAVAAPSVIDVGQASTITLQAQDIYGNPDFGLGLGLYESGTGTSDGALGAVVDDLNGTYTATFTGSAAGTARAISLTVNGVAVTVHPTITVNPLPAVLSINRTSPAGPSTGATSVQYTVTFSEAVTGVAASDFTVPTTGTVTDSAVVVSPVSGSVYPVNINGITGAGTLGLNLVDNGAIRDATGAPLQSNAATAGTFGAPKTYSWGFNSTRITAADFNGDGKPDAAAIYGSLIEIMLGKGDGTFSTPTAYSLGSSNTANSITTADVNGDGKTDIVVTISNSGSKFIAVVLGNGDGTFQPVKTFTVGTSPDSVAVADLNGDGKQELVVANSGSSTVSVLLGNGDGTFQTQTTCAVAADPFSVSVADLNGDGKPDIAVACSTLVSVLFGNGDGTFQAQVTLAAGTGPVAIAASDVSGDGKPDLIVTDEPSLTSGSVTVLIGNGNGTFKSPVTYAVGIEPTILAVVDLNGDGKPDLVTANSYTSHNISILMGNGDGTFQSQLTSTVGAEPIGMAVADFNGDSRPDVITPVYGSTSISVLLSNEIGNFTGQVYTIIGQATKLAYSQSPNGGVAGAGIGTVAVTVEQSNGAILSSDTSPVTLTLSTGAFSTGLNSDTVNAVNGIATFSGLIVDTTGAYTLTATDPTENLTQATANFTITPVVNLARFVVTTTQTTMDVGTVMTVTIGPGSDIYGNLEAGLGVSFYLTGAGTSGGNFGPVEANADGTYSATFAATAAGTARKIAATVNGGLVTSTQPTVTVIPLPYVVAINRNAPLGPTISQSHLNYAITFNEGVTGVVAADFAVPTTGNVTYTGLTVAQLLNSVYTVTITGISGQGSLGLNLVDNGAIRDLAGNPLQGGGSTLGTFATAQTVAVGSNPMGVATADLNADGKIDVVTANENSNNITVLLGNGDGTFQPQANYATNTLPISVTIADINGDKKPDLLVGTANGGLDVFLGNGNGTFSPYTLNVLAGTTFSLAVSDVNRDGKPDLVSVAEGQMGSIVSVQLGNGDGTFQAARNFATGANPWSVTVADMNGDGKPDLVIANEYGATISVLLGNGDGTFQTQKTFALTQYSEPESVTTADLNGDGKLDVIVSELGSSTVAVLLGNGDGTLQAQNTYSDGYPPESVITGDVNGDGKPDLIVTDFGSVSVLVGNGDGAFQSARTFSIGSNSYSSSALADVNSDGRLDIVAVNSMNNTAAILTNASNGSFTGQTYTIQSPIATLTSTGPNPSDVTQGLSFTIAVSGGVPDGETVTLEDASNNNAVVATGTLSSGAITLTVPAGTLGYGTHNLIALYGGDANYSASQSSTLVQRVEVYVTSVVVNGNNASLAGLQRSMVNSLVYTFSEPVTLGANAFTIAVHSGQTGTPPTLHYTSPDGGTTWVVTFSGNGVLGNSIANGVYDITLSTDPAVVSAINHPGAPVQALTNTFFRLFGDANGDGRVNNTDYNNYVVNGIHEDFVAAFGTRLGVGTGYNAIFDANGDGRVNNTDYNNYIINGVDYDFVADFGLRYVLTGLTLT